MTNRIEQVTYTKCAPTKRGARVWIEGAKLTTAGFMRGLSYTKTSGSAGIQMRVDPAGELVVAGRSRNGKDVPIIDLSAKSIEPFDVGDQLRVVFQSGVITISKHHEDTAQDLREENMRTALANGNIKEGSLFSGGGVSTMAIHDAITQSGYSSEVRFTVDQELKYSQVAAANNPAIDENTRIIIGDVEEVESCFYEQVDMLSFSMPCAGFSKAGLSKHGQSPIEHSGTVLFGVMRAIKASNPAVIISENVIEAADSPMYQLLKAELHRTGYQVAEQILDSQHTDSLEQRKRYWLVAVSSGLVDELTLDLPTVAQSGRKLSSILEADADGWAANQYLKDKAITDAAAGKGFKRQLLTGDEDRCGTIGRHYNKRRSTEPFIVKGDQERLLTPVEHARVKSIPEKLIEGVKATLAHEVLGQSIDYLQAVYITMNLFNQLRRA